MFFYHQPRAEKKGYRDILCFQEDRIVERPDNPVKASQQHLLMAFLLLCRPHSSLPPFPPTEEPPRYTFRPSPDEDIGDEKGIRTEDSSGSARLLTTRYARVHESFAGRASAPPKARLSHRDAAATDTDLGRWQSPRSCPRYMTATRSLTYSRTARSWAMKRYVRPNSFCRSWRRLMACACTATARTSPFDCRMSLPSAPGAYGADS